MPYTNVSKPTGSSYTNIAKPTGGGPGTKTIVPGMSIGLLIPLTISVAQTVGSNGNPYTNISKPTGSSYTNIVKPT